MKKRTSTIVLVLLGGVILLTPLLQPAAARERGDRLTVIPFTKWGIPGSTSQMRGFVYGDPDAVFEGSIIQAASIPIFPVSTPVAPALYNHLEVRYDIIGRDPSRSFSVIIHGKQTRAPAPAPAPAVPPFFSTLGILDGVITDGWRAGASVHVEFVGVEGTDLRCKESGGIVCFVGTITILPDQDKDNGKDEDRH